MCNFSYCTIERNDLQEVINLSISANAMAGCIDLLYAVEGAYFVPAIFDSGVSPTYGAMLIAISPIMGI